MVATIVRVTCKRCGEACELTGCTACATYPELGRPDRDVAIKRIREALKRRSGKAWSVKGDRGTAWGWIHISCPPARLGCARLHVFEMEGGTVCRDCGMHYLDVRRNVHEGCALHACTADCFRSYITPEDRAELKALMGLENVHQQGISIMASTDAYIEHIDRAEGRKPRTIGAPYWD
jgi:hypothetical protein